MELAEIFKALDDETRLRILNLLFCEELCVCEIETILNISQSNTSRHLNRLKGAGIISYEKKAQWVYYRVNEAFIKDNPKLCEYLQGKMEAADACAKDKERLKRYRSSNYTCEDIRDVKTQILKYLEGKEWRSKLK